MAKHVIASLREFPTGSRKLVDVRGRKIAVFNIRAAVCATAD
jgi:nitrite reductase/ring-hydroxylating ferredoxin subunit